MWPGAPTGLQGGASILLQRLVTWHGVAIRSLPVALSLRTPGTTRSSLPTGPAEPSSQRSGPSCGDITRGAGPGVGVPPGTPAAWVLAGGPHGLLVCGLWPQIPNLQSRALRGDSQQSAPLCVSTAGGLGCHVTPGRLTSHPEEWGACGVSVGQESPGLGQSQPRSMAVPSSTAQTPAVAAGHRVSWSRGHGFALTYCYFPVFSGRGWCCPPA